MHPSGPPRTVLPAESDAVNDALRQALESPEDQRRPLVAEVVVANPRSLNARDRSDHLIASSIGFGIGLPPANVMLGHGRCANATTLARMTASIAVLATSQLETKRSPASSASLTARPRSGNKNR